MMSRERRMRLFPEKGEPISVLNSGIDVQHFQHDQILDVDNPHGFAGVVYDRQFIDSAGVGL